MSGEKDFVSINGSPAQVGRSLGRIWRSVLRLRVRDTLAIQKRSGIPDTTIASRVRDFARLLKRVEPAWLEEAAAVAEGAGVQADQVLMLNCLPPGFYPQRHSCTGFIRVGTAENWLFKIRDERSRVQTFFIRKTAGRPRYQLGVDIGNLGVAHFFNERALAGANHTGSHTTRVPDLPLLNDCHVLRYFAERATSIEDVPRLYERLMEMRAAGGAGPGRGAIYSLADREGGLLLETVSDAYQSTLVRKGQLVLSNHFLSQKAHRWASKPPNPNTLLRRKRMSELLRRCGAKLTPLQVFAISRDRKNLPHSLCNDDSKHFWMTLSAQLQIIPRDAPEKAVNYICCGNTRHSFYVPVPLKAEQSYVPLLDGRFYQAADALYRQHRCDSHLRGTQRSFERGAVGSPDCAALYRRAFELLQRVRT